MAHYSPHSVRSSPENSACVNYGGRFESIAAFGARRSRQGVFVIFSVPKSNPVSLPHDDST